MWLLFLYQIFKPSTPITKPSELNRNERDPNLDRKFPLHCPPSQSAELTCAIRTATSEPEGILHRASEAYAPGIENSARINATILSLVRNEELETMLQSMRDLERTWNHKFNYPWTFFNDVPFTEEFKRKTKEVTNAECRYGRSHLFLACDASD